MKPTFRTDLTCSREEQQGVVFYRIDDPKAQTSFRLYEIEYLIAKKLDGLRGLAEVIEAVKKEFNFDISEPDLQRFVNQLESMGFLSAGGRAEAMGDDSDPEPETAVMERPQKPAEPMDLLDDSFGSSDLDQAELDRLLRSAFLHVKQGYIVHARDYFLAAKELNPGDDRLAKLVHHLEIIGDSSGPAEVEYLWNQAKELFPDVAEEVGPLIDAKSGGPPTDIGEGPEPIGADEDIKSRVVWALIAVLVLAGGVGGLIFVFSQYGHRIFGTAARVRVATLKAERIPVFYPEPAVAVTPLEEKWLEAKSAGTIDTVSVAVNGRVEAGDIVMSMALANRTGKQLAKAKKALKTAQSAYDKAAKRVEKLNAEREALETEKTAAVEALKELRPKSVLKQGGVSKRDLEKWKAKKIEANQKLTKLAKRERKPKNQLAKVKKKRDAAAKKLEGIFNKIGDRLVRASFTGIIGELKVAAGQPVKAGQPVALLRDPSGVQLTFALSTAPELQPGGETHVAVSRGPPNEAKVLRVEGGGEGAKVQIKLPDPSGGFLAIEPSEFRLVQMYADTAFKIPASALLEGDDGTSVLAALQKRALEKPVEVLQRDAISAVVRGSLRDGVQVIIAHLDEGQQIADIPDGSFLEIEE